MKVYHDYREASQTQTKAQIVSIGNFDGVHVGHKKVLMSAKETARQKELGLTVLTFEPHPAIFLNPTQKRLRLSTVETKIQLLEACGVDTVLCQSFDNDFAQMSGEDFSKQVLKKALNAKLVQIGSNFKFGHNRAEDIASLTRYGTQNGFSIVVHALLNKSGKTVSSSWIRQLIAEGNVTLAATLLDRPYQVQGTVVKGMGHGRKLNFPTINLGNIREMLPGFGIYAAKCEIDSVLYNGAAYIGNRPTMGFGDTVEVHLLDFKGDLYGKKVTVAFSKKIRGEVKFNNVKMLSAQIARDVQDVRAFLGV